MGFGKILLSGLNLFPPFIEGLLEMESKRFAQGANLKILLFDRLKVKVGIIRVRNEHNRYSIYNS